VICSVIRRIALAAILFAMACTVEESAGADWVAVAARRLPEAGINSWTLYRKQTLGREKLDDQVARYRVYGECVVYEKITTTDLYRAACGDSRPIVISERAGPWEFAADGLEQKGLMVTRGNSVFREIRTIPAESIAHAVRVGSNAKIAVTVKHVPVEPTSSTDDSDTALVQAVLLGDASAVETLLRSGANPNQPGDTDRYPIVLAAYGGKPAIVQALLEAGARLDVTTNGFGPLTTATDRNHRETIQLLLATGRFSATDLQMARSHARNAPALLELLSSASE
jgi:hypothetical protein